MLTYHNELINQINAVPLRSYYHIVNKDETVLNKWKFAYFPKQNETILDITPEKEINVPSNWQIEG